MRIFTVPFSFPLVLGLFVCHVALGDPVVLTSVETSGCSVSVEASQKWSSLLVRLPIDCEISQGELSHLLASGMAAAHKQEGVSYNSVFLGRLVDYPWMVKKLVMVAANSDEWDAKRGRAVSGHENPLIGRLLFAHGVLAPEIAIIEKAGYRVTGVSVEKVLVGTAKSASEYIPLEQQGKLPFDAQVWLVLEKASRDN